MPAPANVARVRAADADDCPYLAALHAATLPHGFFVDLGPRFLQAYHRSYVESPHARAYVASVDGRAIGCLVGTLDNRAHWRWVVRRRGLGLAVAGVLGLLTHPRAVARFLRTRALRYPRAFARLLRARWGPGRGGGTASPDRVAVLSHVCVDPAVRQRGIGAGLVETFLDDARAAGAAVAMLATLAGEDGAGGFYARRGWECAGGRSDPDGRALRIYTRALG